MLPTIIRPMLATPADPAEREGWLHEQKWDGVRALACVTAEGWCIRTRGGMALAEGFPEMADALSLIPPGTAIDAEMVVLDQAGRPDFGAVLSRLGAAGDDWRARLQVPRHPITLMAFDLPWFAGESMAEVPIENRKTRLSEVLDRINGPRLRPVDWVQGHGLALFAAAERLGIDGIVAKRPGSGYIPGRRCRSWLKIKVPGYQRAAA